MIDARALKPYFTGLQSRLVAAVETLEGLSGGRFRTDPWQKDADQTLHGDGLTCIIERRPHFRTRRRGLLARHRARTSIVSHGQAP
jgi:hypothetical protein